MENPKQEFIDRIKTANNVLVTVSANPSVDQLSAAIGLTLMLNKMDKHATAVFSGQVPSTIEFLQPEKTLEKNTDSLRDFIIALDKSKADKLRYKVEDDHVKIFITPYRTSITEKDLDFSQGDFNVEVVVALGVIDPRDLDQAITAHGRILHDATTVSVTTGQQSSLGTINWADANASSLCEMVASTADTLQANVMDGQTATALMTGIVAETHRFSNEKTSPAVMSISAKLMAAGANQQLVASKLQEALNQPTAAAPAPEAVSEATSADGSLQIEHVDTKPADEVAFDSELPDIPEDLPRLNQIHVDDNREVQSPAQESETSESQGNMSAIQGGSSLILEPPTLGGKLTANSEPEHLDPAVDPLGGGDHDSPLLKHEAFADNSASVNELPDLSGSEDLPGPSMTLPSEVISEQPQAPAEPETPALPSFDDTRPTTQPAAPQSDTQPNWDETPVETPSTEPNTDTQSLTQTLAEIEESVESPHTDVSPALDEQPQAPAEPEEQPTPVEQAPELAEVADALNEIGSHTTPEPSVDSARDAISAALAGGSEPLPPIAALNAQPLDLEIKQTGATGILDHIDEETGEPAFRMPENLVPPVTDLPADNTATQVSDPTAPPPVPPPLMPNFDNGTLPPAPSQESPQGDTNNPFNLPPA